MNVKRAPFRSAALLVSALASTGCSTDPIKLEQGFAKLASGESVPTNVFRQEGKNAGLGSTQVCLADPNALANNQVVIQGCATTVGPVRGAVDAGAEVAGAAASLATGTAFIKQAFAPPKQQVSGGGGTSTTTAVTEGTNGALSVLTQTGPGNGAPSSGSQTNFTSTGPIRGSNVQVIQGNTGAAFGLQ